MKKTGFTLSELVVAVSIIGVAAAFVVPVVGKFMPDTKKSNVLKYYTLLNGAVANYYNSDNYMPNGACRGLSCLNPANYANFSEYLASAEVLNLEEVVIENGESITVAPDGIGVDIDTSQFPYKITLDTDLNNEGLQYGEEEDIDVAKIDKFTLEIDEDGEVSAGDPLTFAYLKNPYKMNDKEQDLKIAKDKFEKD